MTIPKTGPLTQDDLFEVWKGALDKSYRDPLIAAGEGDGLESHTQAQAVFARASFAVDKTTQEMFISPWSGQTNDPAAGGQQAEVTLTFTRTGLVDHPLVLGNGLIFVEEQTTDWGDPVGAVVQTGRRYVLSDDLLFNPGEMGPFTITALAEQIGEGYNNPLPDTLVLIDQPGSGFNNNLASVLVTLGTLSGPTVLTKNQVIVTTTNVPDTFVPDHVGQYIYFTDGLNKGRTARILSFIGPDLSVFPQIGSKAIVEWDESIEGATFTGTFIEGEQVYVGATLTPTLVGTFLGERITGGIKRATFVVLASTASIAAGNVLTGSQSGATLTVDLVLYPNGFTAEAPVAFVGGASWLILDWATSWGLVVTNVLSPAGGQSPWLDELGGERALYRGQGEPDDIYRQRVAAIADVVTPNAIRRALSRTLGSLSWCFREVGTVNLPGFFYDGDLSPVGGAQSSSTIAAGKEDCYDTDVIIFTGTVTSGTFLTSERVVLEFLPGYLFKADGYFGGIVGGVTFTLIRKNGTLPASFTGYQIRGLTSGAIFTPTSGIIPASVNARRERVMLDYSQFRGYFTIGVPRLGMGEFGFAYDAGPSDAYDCSPFLAFYDGFPYLNAAVYSRVYQAVDEARAGGVLWNLYVEDIGCP